MTDYHSHIHGFEDSFKRLDSHTVRIIKRLTIIHHCITVKTH